MAKLSFFLEDLEQLQKSKLSLAKIRQVVIKDVWLRHLQQTEPNSGWALEGLYTGFTDRETAKVTKEESSILRRIPHTLAESQEITQPLKGFMDPKVVPKYSINPIAESTEKYSKLTASAINSNLIYSKSEVVYVDIAKREEVPAEKLDSTFERLQNEPNKIAHPSAYSVPIKLVPQVSGPGNSTPIIMRATVDRLELLPGISGFAINKSSVGYAKISKMKAEHPLLPDVAAVPASERYLPIVGVMNGPSELTPIFAGNDKRSFEIAKDHGLPIIKSIDVHGHVNYQDYMPYIPNLFEDNKKKYLRLDGDPETRAAIFENRNNLPMELANQAVYSFLSARHKGALLAVPATTSDSYTVRCHLEPVTVTQWFVNTKEVLDSTPLSSDIIDKLKHVANVDDVEAMRDIPLVCTGLHGLQAWRFGIETQASLELSPSFAYRRSSKRIEGRSILRPWVFQVYNDLVGEPGLPIILERDENLLEKVFLKYALTGNGDSLVVPQNIVVADKEVSTKWTLNELHELREGRSVQDIVENKDPALYTYRKASNDTLRGVLLESLEKTDSELLLNAVLLEDIQGINSLLYYITMDGHRLKGVSPRLPLTHSHSSYAKTYERYILFELAALQEQYEAAFANYDYFSAREAVDSAIMLISGKYKAALICDTFDTPSFERAEVCVSIFYLVMQTLQTMTAPFYPDLSRELGRNPILRTSLGTRKQKAQKEFLPPYKKLSERMEYKLSAEKDHAPGKLMFDIVEAVESVLESSGLPRSRYRGYVCTDDFSVFGYDTREDLNDNVTLLIKRICRVQKLMVPESRQVFNSGRLSTIKVRDGVYLQSFDSDLWVSKDEYKLKRQQERSAMEQLED